MGAILPAIGAVSGVVGGIGQKNQQKAANGQAQQALNQGQSSLNSIQQMANQQGDAYNQFYKPLQGGLQSGMQSNLNSANSSLAQILPQLMQAGIDPHVIAKITGLDANALSQQAVQYLSNPNATNTQQVGQSVLGQQQNTGGTNLAKAMPGAMDYFNNPNTQLAQASGGVNNYLQNTGGTNLAQATPGAQGFFQQLQQNGMDPQAMQNAQSQVQQGISQQMNDARAHAQPGQNMNALQRDMMNQGITAQTNLAGNLAGQNQNYKIQGAQGALGAAQGLDSQTMQMLQTLLGNKSAVDTQRAGNVQSGLGAAQGMDAQTQQMLMNALQSAGIMDTNKSNMLQGAANAGSQYNQQAYNNLGNSATAGQNVLQGVQNYLGQGQGLLQSAGNQLSGVSQQAGVNGQVANQNAQKAGEGFANSLGSTVNNVASLFPSKTPQAAPQTDSGSSGLFGGAQRKF